MKCVNTEEKRCRFFTKEREEEYQDILYRYKKAPDFFPDGQFARETGERGNTDVFRVFLMEYISSFEPDALFLLQ